MLKLIANIRYYIFNIFYFISLGAGAFCNAYVCIFISLDLFLLSVEFFGMA